MKTAGSNVISQILEILIAPPPLVACREWRLRFAGVYTGLRIVKRSSSSASHGSKQKSMRPRGPGGRIAQPGVRLRSALMPVQPQDDRLGGARRGEAWTDAASARGARAIAARSRMRRRRKCRSGLERVGEAQ